ncbi:MAG: pyridoxal-phosphate dependent enzyme [Fervidicoccaceae archaeon]
MNAAKYRCQACGWSGPEDPALLSCPRCGSLLELEYDVDPELPEPAELVRCRRGVWCFSRQLPKLGPEPTLGEGATPLREVRLRGARVLLKLESANPTGSFKDRGTPVALASALARGIGVVCEDSSGNAGASLACYARAHGLKALIVTPRTAPRGKLKLVELCGAEVALAESRESARALAIELSRGRGAIYLPHTTMPHHVEGMKTLAYEIFLQLSGSPSHVFVPVSSGTGLLGLYKGFRELREWGYIDELPRLIAVQSSAVPPLYEAFWGEKPSSREDSTLADGLTLERPPRLRAMVEAVRATRGTVVVATNEEIRRAAARLRDYGVVAEPTSAAALAALEKLSAEEAVDEPLVVITGSGLKLIDELLELTNI